MDFYEKTEYCMLEDLIKNNKLVYIHIVAD